MADFLVELLSEEIPARMQDKAAADLRRLFEAEIARAGLKAATIETFAGPRRLALLARGLPAATEPVSEELKGPRADAPEQAIAGFLGKTGLAREDLVERVDAKGHAVLFAVKATPGRPAAEVLADAVPAMVRGFPWPKSMRWGAASASSESPRWVRPLQGIVALLDEAVVPCEAAGIASGRETAGHRFLSSGAVTIARAADYAATLRAAHVIVGAAERQAIVRDGARAAASTAGLALVEDEGLVAENAGLTEWPVPLLGRFDPAYLDVPREVIQLTMRTNQKYFACTDAADALAPAFVCTANIEATDGGAAIVAGNARVLTARLSDARFFWEQDLKVPLAERATKLSGIVFHEKLGTVADKVERVAKLAEWLASEGIVPGCDPALARRAAELCKADLVTGMVGEFPELQGTIGGYLAAAQGEPPEVAAAIRDHYKPVGQSDEVPIAPVTVAVSLADKLDSLLAFLFGQEGATGSKDPFALRRLALGYFRVWRNAGIRGSVLLVMREAFCLVVGSIARSHNATKLDEISGRNAFLGETVLASWPQAVLFDNLSVRIDVLSYRADAVRAAFEFVYDRLKVQQREAGVRHDLIDAVFALGGEDDLVRLLERVRALQAFLASEDGANLLVGYRRAANILRAEAKKGTEAAEFAGFSYQPDPAELALAEALDRQLPLATAALAEERFEAAMTALAALRAPIDRFFDKVTVNADDPDRRSARLALLARLVAATHNVADFSKIEG
ncbi:glycine--tRNA ligase subunit beta [Sphingomonas sp.]|uniref:glycine--tRNA ligase subunit beta n=1 Tax=Sphingomonas sp. TaxID=28214 RepID=UPI003AFFB07E